MTDQPKRWVAPTESPEDEKNYGAYRPEALKDFVGQGDVVQRLSMFIQAARLEDRVLDHVIFSGPPGLGKTTLAAIISKEMHVGLRITAGPLLTKPGDLAAILTNLQPKDVLFIDEIHRLSTAVEETLYSAMEDFRLDIVLGEGPAARVVQVPLPPFTLVGATTRLGLITRPLRERFGIHETMRFYDNESLVKILAHHLQRLNFAATKESLAILAGCSRGTPRVALRILRRVYDIALFYRWERLEDRHVLTALQELEVDAQGLDWLDRSYIKALGERSVPVGIETLSSLLAEQKDVIEDTIEPYLMVQNFIDKTPRGRVLTQKGKDYYLKHIV